jgi:hypothetical protein
MIKIIALKNGITLIAETEVGMGYSKVTKPAAIVMQNSPTGESMIGFSPYLLYAEEFDTGITINNDNYIAVLTPSIEILNAYNKYFGSGIQVADPSILKL